VGGPQGVGVGVGVGRGGVGVGSVPGSASGAAAAAGRGVRTPMPELAGGDGGPPRMWSPLGIGRPYERGVGLGRASASGAVPLMVYLPGLDGTGWAAARQFEGLGRLFGVVALSVPADASPRCFEESVAATVAYLERERAGEGSEGRRVYLLGESFGGVLALCVAQRRPDLVDALVVVNPATSYASSAWPALGNGVLLNVPEELYGAVPFLLAPVLGNPARLVQAAVEAAAPAGGGAAARSPLDVLGDLVGAAPALGALADLLPKPVLRARLKALGDGCAEVLPRLGQVRCPVLVVVGEDDRLIPSAEEAGRLERGLRHARVVRIPGGGHTLLQEAGMDLARVIQDAGFYTRAPAGQGREGLPLPYDPVRDFVPPTRAQVGAEVRPGTALWLTKRLTSPVFYSTRPRQPGDPVVEAGLGALAETLHARGADEDGQPPPEGGELVRPRAGARPVLFVGNHQTLATDLGVVVEHFLTELGVCLRGLAHPVLFAAAAGPSSSSSSPSPSPRGGSGSGSGSGSLAALFSRFGAVRVSGKGLHSLLAGGEAVLLYPGGVREAYRRKGEDYRLFWPEERPEFVRMAHKFGAVIVPLAAVGADDSVRLLLDAGDVLRVPGLGAELLRREQLGPRARSAAPGGDELFLPPLAVPRGPLPNRLYFLAGEPVDPSDFVDAESGAFDAEACYAEVKARLERAIAYLLDRRGDDPHADSAVRILAEQAAGQPLPGFLP